MFRRIFLRQLDRLVDNNALRCIAVNQFIGGDAQGAAIDYRHAGQVPILAQGFNALVEIGKLHIHAFDQTAEIDGMRAFHLEIADKAIEMHFGKEEELFPRIADRPSAFRSFRRRLRRQV